MQSSGLAVVFRDIVHLYVKEQSARSNNISKANLNSGKETSTVPEAFVNN